MVVRNGMSRYHLALEALRWAKRLPQGADRLAEYCDAQLARHQDYVVEHMEDLPEVKDWTWS
jgi:xylulose-5-phosphate/fructose-6-phosphate phosphoketolase